MHLSFNLFLLLTYLINCQLMKYIQTFMKIELHKCQKLNYLVYEIHSLQVYFLQFISERKYEREGSERWG